MLPCGLDEKAGEAATKQHFVVAAGTLGRIGRRLLSEVAAGAEHCQKKVITDQTLNWKFGIDRIVHNNFFVFD